MYVWICKHDRNAPKIEQHLGNWTPLQEVRQGCPDSSFLKPPVSVENILLCNRFGTMYFDEPMKNGNVKKINTESEGVLYHIMLYRHHFSISNETILSIQNDYTAKYFPQTLEALRRRNLDILVELPEVEITYTNFAQSWVHYDYVYKSRHTLGSLFPESGIARTNN